nr:unnamed protein product [Digitaria exilis]
MATGRNGAAVATTRPYNRSSVPRLRWTNELHRSFVRAVDCLGGQDKMQPRQGHRKHSFAIDEGGPKEFFICPPMKRAKAGAEAAAMAMHESMQGNSDIVAAGTRRCGDDYTQRVPVGNRRITECLRWQWQRNAAAAPTLQELGVWGRGTEPFKIGRPITNQSPVMRHLSSKEIKNRCFLFGTSTTDEAARRPFSPSRPPSSIDPKAVSALSSWPSEASCVLSPPSSSTSFSGCSMPGSCLLAGQRINLDLSLSICGS